ncbi:MAG: N-acetyltransferase [Desulfomonilaceae bacterium]|nr:N-acetyltransferase [Desulfomonilaceae bacterium]
MIRRATLRDIKAIHGLIAEQAKDGHILARPMSELYGQVRDFLVWSDEESGELVGCGSLHIVWEDLAEIRSLAVRSSSQRQGVGSRLAEALLREAGEMGIAKVFVLTYRVALFERLGFTQMDKSELPHKIWADCIRCTKFPECDETALVRSP